LAPLPTPSVGGFIHEARHKNAILRRHGHPPPNVSALAGAAIQLPAASAEHSKDWRAFLIRPWVRKKIRQLRVDKWFKNATLSLA
jgi:hypothetical protein